jgi:hypothetical protein
MLANLARGLERNHPRAAASLREGLEQTLALMRLEPRESLERAPSSTNLIENLFSRVRERRTHLGYLEAPLQAELEEREQRLIERRLREADPKPEKRAGDKLSPRRPAWSSERNEGGPESGEEGAFGGADSARVAAGGERDQGGRRLPRV